MLKNCFACCAGYELYGLLAKHGKKMITAQDMFYLAHARCPQWGYSTRFYTERLCLEIQTLTLLYTAFDRKDTPFIYLP